MQTPQAPMIEAVDGNGSELRELARRAATQPEAFALLYDRLVERVYRYHFHRLGSHPDAEDLTAQTFRRALEGIASYRDQGPPFEAWLFRIAHNLLVDRYRAGRAQVSLDGLEELGFDPVDAESPSPPDAAESAQAVAEAWAAVAELPPMQRRAVVLRFGRDLSHAEVGERIGRSQAATKQLLYRAMLTLRGRLHDWEDER